MKKSMPRTKAKMPPVKKGKASKIKTAKPKAAMPKLTIPVGPSMQMAPPVFALGQAKKFGK